jgi:putative FmdB family regulatory protein
MPLFDFNCCKCGSEFESLVLKDDEPVLCPECGSGSVEKITVSLFSCTGVNLTKQATMDSEDRLKKGSDWTKKQEIRKSRIKIL